MQLEVAHERDGDAQANKLQAKKDKKYIYILKIKKKTAPPTHWGQGVTVQYNYSFVKLFPFCSVDD